MGQNFLQMILDQDGLLGAISALRMGCWGEKARYYNALFLYEKEEIVYKMFVFYNKELLSLFS